MRKPVTVIGAAAIGDYIFEVNHLPQMGEIVQITSDNFTFVPGGCAPNIAVGLAAIGKTHPILHYPVGDDEEGAVVRDRWEQLGIETRFTCEVGQTSGKSWMFMQKDGTTMCFAYAGAADVSIPTQTALDGEWCVVCPVLNQFTETYLEMAIQQKKKILVTGIGNPQVAKYLKEIDILLVNKREIRELCEGTAYKSGKELAEAYPNLCLIVTRGGEGSVLFYQGGETYIPTVKPNQIVDFTGAGDAYTSGLVSAVMNGYPYEKAAYFAAANSSFVLEQWGGQNEMPDWDMLTERLEKQFPGGDWSR